MINGGVKICVNIFVQCKLAKKNVESYYQGGWVETSNNSSSVITILL